MKIWPVRDRVRRKHKKPVPGIDHVVLDRKELDSSVRIMTRMCKRIIKIAWAGRFGSFETRLFHVFFKDTVVKLSVSLQVLPLLLIITLSLLLIPYLKGMFYRTNIVSFCLPATSLDRLKNFASRMYLWTRKSPYKCSELHQIYTFVGGSQSFNSYIISCRTMFVNKLSVKQSISHPNSQSVH